MKQQALTYYLDNNYSVIPLGNDKRPALASWTKYQTERADENQINEWWKTNPKANIGIITGSISGITVVDLDTSKMTPEAQTTLEQFPPTYTVQTQSGGYHLYYKYESTISQTANTYPQYPHLDIRNNGGYVVAPPSVGAKGTYTVLKDIPLARFPTELFNPTNADTTKKKRSVKDLISLKEGSRNDALASMAGKLLATTEKKNWDSEVFPALVEINATYKPPLTTTELFQIYQSICKKEEKRLSNEPKSDTEDEASLVAQFKKSGVQGTYAIAEYIVKKYSIITIGEFEREMYVYQNGYYKRAENEIIYPEIQRILKSAVTKNAKTETFHKIADATAQPRSVFESAPVHLIPLKNGVYDMLSKKLIQHDPKYKFKVQFPITYNPTAKCENVSAFFDQVLTPEQRMTVEEWIGYYFYRLYAFKKAIIFVGEGDTGKTTLLETINNLLGKENISGISLHKIAGDKFAGAHLYEKHANIVDELEEKDVDGTGNFKIATGGGSITGEYKFGNQFSFTNHAKLTFACNKIPDISDFDDEAYFNRWIVIRFGKTIEKKIPNFIARLTTEEERSGLFNLAMVGLERLLKNGRFTYGKSAVDTKIEMMRSGSSIAQFASEKVQKKIGSDITKEDMYEAYAQFCNEKELATETMELFGRKFMLYVPYVSEKSMSEYAGVGKVNRVRGWTNVEVIQTPEQQKLEVQSEDELQSLAQHLNGN